MSGESKLGVESLFEWVNDVLGLFASCVISIANKNVSNAHNQTLNS